MTRQEPEALTASEIQEIGDLLRKRKAELTASRATHLRDARSPGERVTEQGDRAEQEIEADQNDSRAAVERGEIAEIDHALAKIGAGTFGVSEVSGAPIGVARLRALPTARVTTLEQEAADRRG
jgi:DnaK suppressor protein